MMQPGKSDTAPQPASARGEVGAEKLADLERRLLEWQGVVGLPDVSLSPNELREIGEALGAAALAIQRYRQGAAAVASVEGPLWPAVERAAKAMAELVEADRVLQRVYAMQFRSAVFSGTDQLPPLQRRRNRALEALRSAVADVGTIPVNSEPQQASTECGTWICVDRRAKGLPCPCEPQQASEPKVHDLKTWPKPFAAVLSGEKRYEIRRNDRDFHVGDVLRLREWDPDMEGYTDRAIDVRVTYMTPGGDWGLPPGLCVMSIEPPQQASETEGLSDSDVRGLLRAMLARAIAGPAVTVADVEYLVDEYAPQLAAGGTDG